ncbi:MAG: polysaccharide export protein, partial [Xanthomonas perforans]|nr:polysaccharide export protein [Xanthomonas perforans]
MKKLIGRFCQGLSLALICSMALGACSTGKDMASSL